MKTGLFLPTLVSLGPYAAGAVQALIQEGGLQFDVIGASSGGVITGSFAATGQIDKLVELWGSWQNKDMMAVDWPTLLRGGFLWAPGLMSNEPEHRHGIDPYISEDKLLRGVRFRFHISNLSSGAEEVLEYPGASLPFRTAVHAAVAVPGLFPTVYYQGSQLADGAILNGCPLDQLMLHTGVERVFVVGVAPQMPVYQPGRNAFEILRTALEWNQYSETMTAIAQAHEQNAWIAAWGTEQEAVKRTIRELIEDPQLQADLLFKADEIYSQCGFPQPRAPVAIIPILPPKNLEGLFGDFKPERSRILLEQGRLDALRVLHSAIAG
ncbi:MAG TPA: patatin-like phospholipase family protein [Chloroflexota bacterium]|nr:patatin-like phospholipase family protein [Chloroflexota bacterium]